MKPSSTTFKTKRNLFLIALKPLNKKKKNEKTSNDAIYGVFNGGVR